MVWLCRGEVTLCFGTTVCRRECLSLCRALWQVSREDTGSMQQGVCVLHGSLLCTRMADTRQVACIEAGLL